MFRKLFHTRFWSSFVVSIISTLFSLLVHGDKKFFSGLINITCVQLFSLTVVFLLLIPRIIKDWKISRIFYIVYITVLAVVFAVSVLWTRFLTIEYVEIFFFNLMWLVFCLERNKKE